MKKNILMSFTASAFIIVGCGTSTSTSTNANITGTVPGTLIEAFCDDGYYAKVTSTNNGTDQHPFEIEVPKGVNCRLIMTTNENDPENRVITPIAFSNGTTIVLNADIDLGNIPLELSYENANDKDGDHVVDEPLHIDSKGATTNNNPVHDANGNGMVDAYDDDDHDTVPNAYEDDDHDGIDNIHDDNDNDGLPAHVDNNDNMPNGNDDTNHNDDNDNDRDGNDDTNHNDDNDNDRDGNDDTNHNDDNDNDRDENDDMNHNDDNDNDHDA